MKIGNRRLRVSASIQSLCAKLEVIRLANLEGRSEETIDLAISQAHVVITEFDERLEVLNESVKHDE